MNPRRFFTLLALTAVFVVSAVAQQTGTKPLNYKKIKYPKLKEMQIPEPTRYELSNGMVVYLLEDHTLPTIGASVMVHTGTRNEPADKVGLASITGQVMRTGGTTAKTGDEIDEMLERAAASVETFIGLTSGGARLSVLKEDIDMGISTLADILRNPAFRDEKIDLAKIQQKSGISRRNDQVQGIAGREFNKLIYGVRSPYARTTEYETIENITKQDLVDFHKKYFLPNNMMIAFWGDFKTDEMKVKIEKAFGDWPKGSVMLPPSQQPRMAAARSVNFVKKTDVNQSNIYIGHLGGKLNDPESPMLNLADQALGGGFASRLFTKVRTQQGLAYAIGSGWLEGFDYPGAFRMSGSTKSGTTVKMVNSILSEFGDILKNGITDEELNYAKDSFLNSYVFEWESKASVINKLMSLEFFGYPKDYYQKQIKEIQGATKKAVNDAIKKRWDADKLTILVVGNDAEFDLPLSSLGDVRTIDITIPAAPEKIPDPTPETTLKGKDLLKKTLAAMGGEKYLGVKDIVESMTMKIMNTPMGDMEMQSDMTMVLPSKLATKMSTAMGEMTSAWDGTSGWMDMGGRVMDLPGSRADDMKKQTYLNPLNVLQNFEKPDYVVYWYKDDKVADKPVSVVYIRHTPTNASSRWFVDTQTGLVVKTISKQTGPSGPTDAEQFFSDYRNESGVILPHKMEVYMDGKKNIEMTVTGVKINSGVKDEVFKKPQ
ncbi:MAG: pitrilysin family protein [Bacteroidota bacterium]